MKNLFKVLSIFSAFLLFSCSCSNYKSQSLPSKSRAVDVDGASEKVSSARDLSIQAGSKISIVKSELKKAKEETKKAEVLIVKMKESKSPFTPRVEKLKNTCVSVIKVVSKEVSETGDVLDRQLVQLKGAQSELNEAREASAKSEAEKDALRSYGKEKAESLAKCEKEAEKLQAWKDKNMWYKKFFWWTITTVVILGGAWLYFTGATGGLARFLRR